MVGGGPGSFAAFATSPSRSAATYDDKFYSSEEYTDSGSDYDSEYDSNEDYDSEEDRKKSVKKSSEKAPQKSAKKAKGFYSDEESYSDDSESEEEP